MKKISLYEFKHNVAQINQLDPIVIQPQRAKGVYIWDVNGKDYIDMLSGICVANVGHSNKNVINAIKKQIDQYMHVTVYGEYIQSQQYKYIKRLKEFLPSNLNQIFYVNSGSEAIEGAIKTAKLYNHRPEIISYKNSYHGATMTCVSMLSDENYREDFLPLLPDTNNIEFNNETDLQKITEKTCCVIAETIAVGAGVELPKNDYLIKLRKRCDEVGAVLILDEIQTGFGRTGSLFAFQQYGFVPDILCIAKAMGAGLPIGAFIGSDEIMNHLNDNPHPLIGHATTYGGNPVCLASALASLNYIVEDINMEEVKQKGEYYRTHLKHKLIKEVRGIGLFNCFLLQESVSWEKVLAECYKQGVIVGTHLFNSNCISIKPPLIITQQEIDESIRRITIALNNIR